MCMPKDAAPCTCAELPAATQRVDKQLCGAHYVPRSHLEPARHHLASGGQGSCIAAIIPAPGAGQAALVA